MNIKHVSSKHPQMHQNLKQITILILILLTIIILEIFFGAYRPWRYLIGALFGVFITKLTTYMINRH